LNRTATRSIACQRSFQLADRLFAQALTGGEQRLAGQNGECLVSNRTERRRIVDRLVDVEEQHAPHSGRLLLPFGLGLDVGCFRILLGLLLDLTQGHRQLVVDGIAEGAIG